MKILKPLTLEAKPKIGFGFFFFLGVLSFFFCIFLSDTWRNRVCPDAAE